MCSCLIHQNTVHCSGDPAICCQMYLCSSAVFNITLITGNKVTWIGMWRKAASAGSTIEARHLEVSNRSSIHLPTHQIMLSPFSSIIISRYLWIGLNCHLLSTQESWKWHTCLMLCLCLITLLDFAVYLHPVRDLTLAMYCMMIGCLSLFYMIRRCLPLASTQLWEQL